jgi:WD40 repeat protein
MSAISPVQSSQYPLNEFFDDLSSDSLAQFFQTVAQYLPLRDVAAASSTFRKWNQMFNHKLVWNSLFQRDFHGYTAGLNPKADYALYKNLTGMTTQGALKNLPFQPDWSAVNAMALYKNKFALYTKNQMLEVWDMRSGKKENSQFFYSDIQKLSFTDENTLLLADRQKALSVWNLTSSEVVRKMQTEHTGFVAHLIHEGDNVFSGDMQGSIEVWNLKSGERENVLQLGDSVINGDNLVLMNGQFITKTDDNKIKIWDAESGAEIDQLGLHDDGITVLIPYGKDKIISASADKIIKIWDLTQRKLLATLQGHAMPICSLCIAHGRILFSGSVDCTVRLWDLASNKHINTLEIKNIPNAIYFSDDGKCLTHETKPLHPFPSTVGFWDLRPAKVDASDVRPAKRAKLS